MQHAAEYDGGDFDLGRLDDELADLASGFEKTSGQEKASHPDQGSRLRDRLLTDEAADGFRGRWTEVQAGFVEEPKRAVEQADHLVDQILKRLTEDLRKERDALVRRWDHGRQDTSTEELRQALMGYRSLMDRLLRL